MEEELLSDFVAETQESLEALGNVAVALEADPNDRRPLDELFRFFHTVKGSSGFLALPRFERLSHAAEDVLSGIRDGRMSATPSIISAVLAVMDRIAELCASIVSGESLDVGDDAGLIDALRATVSGEIEPAEPEAIVEISADQPLDGRKSAATARTIRLPLTLIDQLMNGVSDMVLARNELARKLRAIDPAPELESAFERLSGCVADMRDSISRTRMQRVDRLFLALPRMVRDIGRDLGKRIDLSVEGGDVEMDREMVEMVVDPLTHIVRNSIDHGIETPEQRRAAGKPEAGRLRVAAHQSGSHIVIEVSDDGRGIDTARVAAKVVSAGLMGQAEVARLSIEEQTDLVFLPGLSTAHEVTALSGRGVGMDVVRANIERLGGLITLANAPGKGLTITMRVPLTLTIIPGLVLTAGGLSFAIPRSTVIEILRDNNTTVSISRSGGASRATIRDRRYSMVDLEEVLGLPVAPQVGPRALMLVRAANGQPYVLGASSVDNHEELVIRPAAPAVMATDIYGGMTLPDNGQPMLLLDAGGIARVAQLPLQCERIERNADSAAAAAGQDSYTALRFVELTGEDRVIRLSLVDRVEDVPVGAFGRTSGRWHATVEDRLIRCAYPVEELQANGAKVVTCLRVRDGARELLYPVREVLDIVEAPVRLDMAARSGVVAGLALIDGVQMEVIDPHALLALAEDAAVAATPGTRRCIIADADDPWNREILAPLLVQSGYDVVLGADPAGVEPGDVVIVAAARPAPSLPCDAPVLRLRPGSRPEGADDDSIYRYDRDGILRAIEAVRIDEVAA